MTAAPRRLVAAAVLLVALSGCSLLDPAGAPINDGITVLAKADGWGPAVASDEDAGGYYAILEIAYDGDAARAAWADAVPPGLPERSGDPREAGLYGSLDEVDLDEQVLVVFSSRQSGSCPAWLGDVSVEDGQVLLEERVRGDTCTADYNPYRLVLAVDRDKLPAEADLPTEDVLFGGDDTSGLVTTYPPGG